MLQNCISLISNQMLANKNIQVFKSTILIILNEIYKVLVYISLYPSLKFKTP